LAFQGETSQIQDFFSTHVQLQDYSGTDFLKFKIQDFSGPVGTLLNKSSLDWFTVQIIQIRHSQRGHCTAP